MFFAFLLSFHLSALAEGRGNQAITSSATFSFDAAGYFVIINPQYFTVDDSPAHVVYQVTGSQSITVKLAGSYTNQKIYYYYGKFDEGTCVDFVIGYNPAPLIPRSTMPNGAQDLFTVYLPTSDSKYSMQYRGEDEKLFIKLNAEAFKHRGTNDTYFSFSVKATEYYTTKIEANDLETPLYQIIDQQITSTSLPDFYSVFGPYYFQFDGYDHFWSTSVNGQDEVSPVNSSILNTGINNLVFAKSSSGNDKYTYELEADYVFVITRPSSLTGITGKVSYVENSKEKPSKEFEINDKTVTIVCNVKATLEISSSVYPVVRVAVFDSEKVPYTAGWASVIGPSDFSLTSSIENKTYAVFVANPTNTSFTASSSDYSVTIYDFKGEKHDSDETFTDPHIVYFKIGKLKDDVLASVQFGTHLFDSAYSPDIVYSTNSEASLQAGIYEKKPSSNTGVIVGVTIAVILVVGAVSAVVIYFRCFKYADSV